MNSNNISINKFVRTGLITTWVIYLVTVTASPAKAEVVNLPIPKQVISTTFNTALSTMKLTLDNYGKKRSCKTGYCWHDKNASLFEMGNGSVKTFTLPGVDHIGPVLKVRRWKGYINKLSTQNISAMVTGDKINVTMNFESQGSEIITKCLKKGVRKPYWDHECSHSVSPKGDINNAILAVKFKPVVYKGSISYDKPEVAFDADIQLHGPCDTFDGLCDKILKYKSQIRDGVKSNVSIELNKASNKNMVANRVRSALKTAGVLKDGWEIKSLTSNGSNFILRVERPDQIGAASVKSLKLTSIVPAYTHTCPINARFKSTINTQYAMGGTAWLVYENGQTSSRMNWHTNKPGKVISTLTRKYSGALNQQKQIWTKLVVSYKGVDNKIYTKESNKAYHTVKCVPSAASSGIKLKL